MLCTKSSLGFAVIINTTKIIFICSHLPIDLNDHYLEKLGYNERAEAMRDTKTIIINKMIEIIGEPTVILWGGDLNFRIQSDGVEQLERFMSRELANYTEVGREFLQTSKYVEFDSHKSGYNTFVRKRKSPIHAYSLLRIPSYCDRVIYKGQFTPIGYYSWPFKSHKNPSEYPKSIAYSDHEPVVLEGTINLVNTT
jgi:hypothetical protein